MLLAYLSEFGLLNDKEMEEFKEEFGRYLLANGIDSDNWERLKSDDFEVAEKIVHMFCHSALDKIVDRISYLEFRSKSYASFAAFSEDSVQTISVETMDENTDLSVEMPLNHEFLQNVEMNVSSRELVDKRSEEILNLCLQGFRPSEPDIFKTLREFLNRVNN